jgi:hypothetical protein
MSAIRAAAGRRRTTIWIAAAAVGAIALGAPAAIADPLVGSLHSGQSTFWNGSYVSNERVEDPSLCGVQGPCINYTLNVTSTHAKVLRVALRTPDDANGWGVVLFDPAGNQVTSGSTYTLHGVAEDFDVEVWAHNPAPGAWRIEVVPQNVVNGTFQMRAGVDPVVNWPSTNPAVQVVHATRVTQSCHTRRTAHHGRTRCVARRSSATRIAPRTGVYNMPPDLGADAPWHLTFDQPTPMVVVESGNFLAAAGLHNSSASVAGQQAYDCLPEETIEQGGHRCLRFTSGFASLGPGKFEVYGSSSSPVAPAGGPLYQNVYRSNGTSWSRPAGTFAFHEIHAHYHVLGIAQFQIYRVASPGNLVTAGTVLKEGFCLGDIKMFNWYSFAQSEIDPSSQDNCEPSLQPDGTWRFYEGIDAGWEDSYKWQTSGQFVNFSGNPDGLYVLRVTVNPYHYLLEADAGHDTNNVAYTYFRVTGNDIHVLERGHGYSPWDPQKQVEDPVFGEYK